MCIILLCIDNVYNKYADNDNGKSMNRNNNDKCNSISNTS